MAPSSPFDHLRQTALSKLDRSPKGSIDEPVLPILDLVNSHPDWVSTSSCSGRIAVYAPPTASTGVVSGDGEADGDLAEASSSKTVSGKGGGRWLFVSHSTLSQTQLDNPIRTIFGESELDSAGGASDPVAGPSSLVHLKYEAPVLHLAARSVETALPLLRASIAAGYRNSGLVVGGSGRAMLGVRTSPGGLDVPLARCISSARGEDRFRLLVDEAYLRTVWDAANELMKDNARRLSRLQEEFEKALAPAEPPPTWEPEADRRVRKRREGLAKQAAMMGDGEHTRGSCQDSELVETGFDAADCRSGNSSASES